MCNVNVSEFGQNNQKKKPHMGKRKTEDCTRTRPQEKKKKDKVEIPSMGKGI